MRVRFGSREIATEATAQPAYGGYEAGARASVRCLLLATTLRSSYR